MVETPDDRAREPTPRPQEEVTVQTLMDFLLVKFEEQDENNRLFREELGKQFKKQNEMFDKHFAEQNEILREQKEEIIEQFTVLRTELREDTNTWKAERSEVQEKQEEEMNKNYEDVRKVQDNAVEFTDVSANKKLSTVGSKANVISNPRKKWIKKRNDFVSCYLTMSEDDYHDMDRDNKSLIPSNRMRKRHKLNDTRVDTASVKPMMNYLECGTGTNRLSSRAAAIRSMKRKIDVKMNTACYGAECKFKQAMDDVKRKNLQDPYINSSWARNVMRKRRRMKFAERL